MRRGTALHHVEHGLLGMAEVDREEHLARDHVARVGPDLDQAHRAHGRRRVRQGDLVDALDHARGTQERVLAQVHGRGAGVGVLAGDGDLVPAHALHALDHADHLALGLEDRALLDVQLEQGAELVAAHRLRAAVADPLQLVAEALALAVLAGIGVVGREHAGIDARASMAGAKREPSSLVQLTTSIGALVS